MLTNSDKQWIAGQFGKLGSPKDGEASEAGKKPVLLRFSPQILARIDRAAKRLGITRSAFIYMASVKELEKIET